MSEQKIYALSLVQFQRRGGCRPLPFDFCRRTSSVDFALQRRRTRVPKAP